MPVPKRKRSKQRQNKRMANKGLKPAVIVACQTCQAPLLPHQACSECGYYKGMKVIRTKADRFHERSEKFRTQQEKLKTKSAASEASENNQ